jgi:hypothetical protein
VLVLCVRCTVHYINRLELKRAAHIIAAVYTNSNQQRSPTEPQYCFDVKGGLVAVAVVTIIHKLVAAAI